ncbi:hypothetical protein EYC84_006242 [Monilinia fructicola]|uniref:N-alpha-acetyltransferase 40 n=1 Tax=Monilinia fructicola TaxID=38448 RepID=A0A5M9K581_MONFR|nr:hypothetical protein EYC84_006242 [Monilinia fructicola]
MSTLDPNPIEIACDKSLEDFERDYMPPRSSYAHYTAPSKSSDGTSKSYKLGLYTPKTLPPKDLTACLNLIEKTSGKHYRESRDGWSVRRKRSEMMLWDLRYLVVREGSSCHGTGEGEWEDAEEAGDGEGGDDGEREHRGEEEEETIVEEFEEEEEGEIKGFMSFMPTFEDGIMVLYLYEIHLVDEVRGTGLGTHLMSIVTSVAQAIPGVKKTMLTCYTANEAGLKFYRKLGYETDEFSPEPKRLKGGRVVENDYVILSKCVDRKDEGEGEGEERRIGDGKRKRSE